MNLINGLTYDDVLLVPQYSEIDSRSKIDISVKLTKNIHLKNPLIPANMKTVTGYEMAKAVYDIGGMAILHRFMTIQEQLDILEKVKSLPDAVNFIGFSVGVKTEDYENVDKFVKNGAKILCIDIAHGDSKMCVDMTKYISDKYPDVFLISGNIATYAGSLRLWEAGADAVKVGIGPGCFAAGTRVLMSNGFYKNIEDIKPGDSVINKDGKPVKVIDAFSTGVRNVSKLRNPYYSDTYVTPDHRFWVEQNGNQQWVEINDVKTDFLFPNNIKFENPKTFSIKFTNKTLKPTYELGLLFGSFLSNGKIDNNTVTWIEKQEITSDLVNKVFGITPTTINNTFSINNQIIADMFSGLNNGLPNELFVNNLEYLGGLFCGLSNSEKTIELSNILNYMLFGTLPNSKPGLNYLNINNSNYESTDLEMQVYDITVDCDTHSFIANNMIVHNSLCTTRIETGNGVPQLTAIMNASEARKEFNKTNPKDVFIIADGGIKNAGDCVKALCYADLVMAGNVFAGTVESPGNTITIDGKPYKEYVGSSTHKGTHIEGVAALVPSKGYVSTVFEKLFDGIKSGISYQGCLNFKELRENHIMIKMTASGLRESHPHDVHLK